MLAHLVDRTPEQSPPFDNEQFVGVHFRHQALFGVLPGMRTLDILIVDMALLNQITDQHF